MGDKTTIAWTKHTFNPWRGCSKVSPGCTNCYAEDQSRRNPQVLGEWGPNARRVIAAESGWRKPLTWNREAEADGERHRVFCASLADVFEDRHELVEPRARLFRLIRRTPWLDWQLLTKRPENIRRLWPTDLPGPGSADWPNVWLGTSIESSAYVQRATELVRIPSRIRFVSAEPLLGPLALSPWLDRLDWIIVGGESGPQRRRRELQVEWVRTIYDQCKTAGVAFFCKQDSGPNQGEQGKIPDDLWRTKEFPS